MPKLIPKRPRKKQQRRLTDKEKKFIEARSKGLSMKDSALAAGYCPTQPSVSATRVQQQLENKALDIFEAEGITDEFFVKKCIKPALFATEVKTFMYKGRVIHSKPMIAWTPRTTTNALVAKMKGLIKEEQPQQPLEIRAVMLDARYRPPVLPPAPNGEGLKAEGNGNGDGISH